MTPAPHVPPQRPARLCKKPSTLPAVEVVAPGASYNPSFQAHQVGAMVPGLLGRKGGPQCIMGRGAASYTMEIWGGGALGCVWGKLGSIVGVPGLPGMGGLGPDPHLCPPTLSSPQTLLLQAHETELKRQKAEERLERQLRFPTAAEAPTQVRGAVPSLGQCWNWGSLPIPGRGLYRVNPSSIFPCPPCRNRPSRSSARGCWRSRGMRGVRSCHRGSPKPQPSPRLWPWPQPCHGERRRSSSASGRKRPRIW